MKLTKKILFEIDQRFCTVLLEKKKKNCKMDKHTIIFNKNIRFSFPQSPLPKKKSKFRRKRRKKITQTNGATTNCDDGHF